MNGRILVVDDELLVLDSVVNLYEIPLIFYLLLGMAWLDAKAVNECQAPNL